MITDTQLINGWESIPAGQTTTALSLAKTMHLVTADAGGDIFTLASGIAGQEMYIYKNSATGVATITPAGLIGGTSIIFNAAGDSVHLLCAPLTTTTTAWTIVGGNSYVIV